VGHGPGARVPQRNHVAMVEAVVADGPLASRFGSLGAPGASPSGGGTVVTTSIDGDLVPDGCEFGGSVLAAHGLRGPCVCARYLWSRTCGGLSSWTPRQRAGLRTTGCDERSLEHRPGLDRPAPRDDPTTTVADPGAGPALERGTYSGTRGGGRRGSRRTATCDSASSRAGP
jgi:hypothetical protein